jgi:hypothetical protein
MPPTIPAITPEKSGAPEARATPRQSGRATRKTTIDAGKSARRLLKTDGVKIGPQDVAAPIAAGWIIYKTSFSALQFPYRTAAIKHYKPVT